jgi:hypothetical protein
MSDIKKKEDIKTFVEKMSDEELQRFVASSVTEEIANGKDEMLDAAIDECKKRGLEVLSKQK